MFANMALDSSTTHLVFKFDPTKTLRISPVLTTIFSGPLIPQELQSDIEKFSRAAKLNSSQKRLNTQEKNSDEEKDIL